MGKRKPLERPFRRTCRPYITGEYSPGGYGEYLYHDKYAKSPENYTRAFLLIQKDLQELFDYIEPSYSNRNCYSYRIHSLLLRSCVEVEANCRAILIENGYAKINNKGENVDMNRGDYKKINTTHHLSSYKVKIPFWKGSKQVRTPFIGWAKGKDGILPWYDAYNATKHDRHNNFEEATFENLIDAVSGLLVILSSQFFIISFSPSDDLWSYSGTNGWISGIGGYFQVQFPHDWPLEMRYGFNLNDWNVIKQEADPYQSFDYSKI